MIPAIFAACASYAGGVVTGKIKTIDGGVTGLCRMNFCLTLISLLMLVPALLLSCPNIFYSGHLVKDRYAQLHIATFQSLCLWMTQS